MVVRVLSAERMQRWFLAVTKLLTALQANLLRQETAPPALSVVTREGYRRRAG